MVYNESQLSLNFQKDMLDSDHKQSRLHQDRKEQRPFEGRRINPQLSCHQHPPKHKIHCDPSSNQNSDIETFRTLLSKKDRHKESQSKLQYRPLKKNNEQTREQKEKGKKESSKSRSRSKGLLKSKSLKQIVKKSKSMVRLQPKREQHKEERKSESPQGHAKSTISYEKRMISAGLGKCKSNYNSKTTRQMMSEITTEREKSKSKLKLPKTIKTQKYAGTKKGVSKFAKKKNEKENVKVESKGKKGKKKRVLISEEHSKVRRQCEDWEYSLNQDQFLNPRSKDHKSKSKGKQCNIVDVPKRKERLSLNANHPRKPSLKTKTEAEVEMSRFQKKELEWCAAIKIQKVFRGYLTRKYIRQCFEHNAAIKIQKVWKGYVVRKHYTLQKKQRQRQQLIEMSPLRVQPMQLKIFEQQDYLLQQQGSKSRSNLRTSQMNEKWTSILEQILSEESVSQTMKKKIQLFLSSQQKQMNSFEILQGNKSPSARSSISSQVIHNQIASQRHFIEQERKKRENQQSHKDFIFLSPKEHNKLSSSPYGQFCSPQNKLFNSSPPRSSTELLICNLKTIQKTHRDRLNSKANDQKQQLNNMLIKNKLSPRTHEKRYKEVDLYLQSELQKFNESVNQIVKNCMLYGEDGEDHLDNVTTTPKKQLTQLEMPSDVSPHHHAARGEEMSLEFREYYQNQRQTAEQLRIQPSFDTSYQFIEEYLISLIDFVRQFEGGIKVQFLLDILHKPINLNIETIIHHMRLMTENGEDEEQQIERCFKLPLYKYMDQEEEIIQSNVIEQFNAWFPKLRINQMETGSQLQDIFVKMIGDCMNEALNSLRPKIYPFVEASLSSINVLKGLEKIPFECESSQQQMKYQYICAQAMNKIFYWNKLQMGKIIRYQQDGQNFSEIRQILLKEEEQKMGQIIGNETWTYYEELIEIIGLLTEDLFENVLFQEIASFWQVFLEWTDKTCRSTMQISPPDNRTYFLP